MASTSGIKQSRCSNTKCGRAIGVSKPGWEFLAPEVDLCSQCYIVYMKKQFCNIYHNDSTSWSFCKLCNKKIQCPCLVSRDWHTTLEDEAIICKGCAPQDATMVSNSQEIMHESTNTTTPLAPIAQTQVENNQVIIIDEEDSHEEQRSPSPALAQARERTEKPGVGTSRKNDVHRFAPRMTDDELSGIFKGSNVEIIPLFEKILSASDTGKSGRLVLPKKCAEEFFPPVDDNQCHHIEIQDSEGEEWKFRLKMWPNNYHKMYVLEDFKPFVRSKKLVQGNIVTISKLVPQGKLVIGIRKDPSSSNQGNDTTSTSKHATKDKMTRKANAVTRVQPGLVIAEGGLRARRKKPEVSLTGNTSNKQEKRLEVVERAPEFVHSHGKGILRRSTSKPIQKFKNKSNTGNTNVMISTLEPRPSKPVENEVTKREIVVALPAPLKWINKHRRHRSSFMGKVCMPPTAGSMQNLPNQSPSHEGGTSNIVREDPKSSNKDAQMSTGWNDEDNQNTNIMTGSQSKGLLFDLNILPEIDEELMDTMNLDQETSSSEM